MFLSLRVRMESFQDIIALFSAEIIRHNIEIGREYQSIDVRVGVPILDWTIVESNERNSEFKEKRLSRI